MYFNFSALSLYKGILPPILADTPKRAVKFFTFEQYKKALMFGSSKPSALVNIAHLHIFERHFLSPLVGYL